MVMNKFSLFSYIETNNPVISEVLGFRDNLTTLTKGRRFGVEDCCPKFRVPFRTDSILKPFKITVSQGRKLGFVWLALNDGWSAKHPSATPSLRFFLSQ